MPFGGNDWHALRQEEPLEPEIPICDPHHHFWDYRTERIPYQRYLLHELAADMNSGHNVTSTVFVEARSMYRATGPEEMRPVGEVEFVQGLAAASASGLYGPGRAAASIVGHANLNLGERRQAGAGGVAGGQPQPLPRHPPLGHVGPAPGSGEHRRAPGREPDVQRQLPRRRPRAGQHGPDAGRLDVLPADVRAGRVRQSRA